MRFTLGNANDDGIVNFEFHNSESYLWKKDL